MKERKKEPVESENEKLREGTRESMRHDFTQDEESGLKVQTCVLTNTKHVVVN